MYYTTLQILLTVLVTSSSAYNHRSRRPCQPIEEPKCQGIGYNLTMMPNVLNHATQAEASTNLLKYQLLIDAGCSRKLQFFLCTLHFPLCDQQVKNRMPACRSLCEEVRDACEPAMRQFRYTWPESLNCSKLPSFNESRLCMEEDKDKKFTGFGRPFPDIGEKHKKEENSMFEVFVTRLGECVPRCNSSIDVMYSSTDKKFVYYWMSVLAVLCFVSSLSTVVTFLVDSKRFRYPERAIVFLSLSYCVYAMGYIIRVTGGEEGRIMCAYEDDDAFFTRGFIRNKACMFNFLLLYYFGMAASAWWVAISVSWFMAARLKWGEEAIEAKGVYFHLVAWLLPAAQTIAVFLLQMVDGDELTGMCYVGNWNSDAHLWFIIVPLSCYLMVGVAALLTGFASVFKVQKIIKDQAAKKKRKKHKKLVFKIGLFSLLYTIPAFAVIVINIYEYKNYTRWREVAENTWCQIDRTKTTAHYPFYNGNHDYSLYNSNYMTGDDRFNRKMNYPKPQQPPVVFDNDNNYDYEYDYANGDSLFTGKSLYKLSEEQQYEMKSFPRSYHYTQNAYPYNQPKYPFYYQQNFDPRINNPVDGDHVLDCKLENSIPHFYVFVVKIFVSLIAGITTGIWIWNGKTCRSWKNIFCFRTSKKTIDCAAKNGMDSDVHDRFHANASQKNNQAQYPLLEKHSTVEYGNQKPQEKFSFFRRKSDTSLPYLTKPSRSQRDDSERYVQVRTKNILCDPPMRSVPNKDKVISLQERRENYYENLASKRYTISPEKEQSAIGRKLATDKYVAQKPNLIPHQYDLKLSYVSQPNTPPRLVKSLSQQNNLSS